jgi:hypothetical protein
VSAVGASIRVGSKSLATHQTASQQAQCLHVCPTAEHLRARKMHHQYLTSLQTRSRPSSSMCS